MTSKIVKLIKAKLKKIEKGWQKVNPLKDDTPHPQFKFGKRGEAYLKKGVPVY